MSVRDHGHVWKASGARARMESSARVVGEDASLSPLEFIAGHALIDHVTLLPYDPWTRLPARNPLFRGVVTVAMATGPQGPFLLRDAATYAAGPVGPHALISRASHAPRRGPRLRPPVAGSRDGGTVVSRCEDVMKRP